MIGLSGRYHNALFAACIFAGLLLSWLFSDHQLLTGDQTQMLHKGYLGAYEGVWLSYGNAASAVGNVPGSLSAWLIGGPLLLWDSPYAPMLLLLAMRLVGFLLFDAVIRQVFDDRALNGNVLNSNVVRLLFLVLCWLNPWFQYESLLYNPSYLFLFSAMHCWSAWHMRERASFWHMIVHLLAIGMAMQLHYSWPLLAVISTYLFWRRILKVSWSGVVVAALLIGASLIPYAMEVMSNSHITQNVDPEARQRYIGWGLVHVYPVLKSVIYWLRYGSWLFASKLVNDTQFIWLAGHEYLQLAAVWLWRVVIYGVGSATVLLAAKAKHKIIEINNHSLEHGTDAEHWNVCRKIAERCAELGVGIGVSTDAHIGMSIGKLDHARKMLDEIHFPLDLIVTRDRETLLREMAAAGVCDLGNGM